jgi:inosine-uridine nucleoside N-ribohydrolase
MGGSISGGNVNASAEANIYNDPEAAQIVFSAGWPLTMVGLDVGDHTLFTSTHLAQLRKNRGPQNDFAAGVLGFMVDLWGQGTGGAAMYDPLAVGVAIDAALVTTQKMRVDVETRGEFTRGETVANRHNTVERNVLHDDRFVVEGLDTLQPNVRVCVAVDAEAFLQMLISRLSGK